jgi:hypothetical protein
MVTRMKHKGRVPFISEPHIREVRAYARATGWLAVQLHVLAALGGRALRARAAAGRSEKGEATRCPRGVKRRTSVHCLHAC